MPILSVAARNASLDGDYGATAGPNAAAAHEVALFVGNPADGGVEVTGGSYARPVITNDGTGWDPAADGGKPNADTVPFPTPTASWGIITHWLLIDAADSVTGWDYGAFAVPLDVTTPGGSLSLEAGALVIYYADTLGS